MWTTRNNSIKDELIPRISANNLTKKQFEEQYANENKPVIITDLSLWKDNEQRTILDINDISKQMNENYLLKNVFVSANNHRFLYFDRNAANIEHEKFGLKSKQMRKRMTWNEFIARARIQKHSNKNMSNNNEYQPLLAFDEQYYLYGEPIPSSLIPFIKAPHFLPNTEQRKKNNRVAQQTTIEQNEKEFKSGETEMKMNVKCIANVEENEQRFVLNAENCMLWLSLSETCSALHFDLCEGLLCQLCGIKKVILFPMKSNALQTLYAYPMESEHRRQSKISNIHEIDFDQYPLFKNIIGYQGTISADEGLYIPIGFWHQIESDCEIGSVSLSFRWNPYLHIMQQSILTSESKKTPGFLSEYIFNQCIQSLPLHVCQLSHIWKKCWRMKVNAMKNKTQNMCPIPLKKEHCDIPNVQTAFFLDVD